MHFAAASLQFAMNAGNVLQPGAGAVMARIAQFEAGIPKEVPVSTVNRQCSSGLQALMNVVGGILAGSYDAALGCGVESMSLRDMQDPSNLPDIDFDVLSADELAADCLVPMGITSENVAEKYGITREQQDAFAARSQSKAAQAQRAGAFKDEIVPVSVSVEGGQGGSKTVIVDADDGIREGTTAEKLSKLRTVFKQDGTTTAGNSSQVSDGAAAVLVMRRWLATKHSLPVLGVVRAYSVVGVEPKLMGIGPAAAIPPAVAKAGLKLGDVGVFEINEAFASQAVYCVRELGIPLGKVNPNGGAIALGHPLGCTGARMVATLLHEMKRTKQRYGVVSMCIGSGMGAAAVFEHEV